MVYVLHRTARRRDPAGDRRRRAQQEALAAGLGQRLGHDVSVAGAPSRPHEYPPAGTRDGPAAGAGPRRTAHRGLGLRRLPHRPARHRGRPAGPPGRTSCPGTRSWARWSRSGTEGSEFGGRRPGRHRVAAGHVWRVPVLRAGPGELVSAVALHGLGCRRWICRFRDRASRFRIPPAGRLHRRRARAAAVRRHHRIPGPDAGRAARRRAARDLRIRRQRAHHRPGRAGPWRRGARDDAGCRRPRARPRARRGFGPGRRRSPAGPARRARSCSRRSASWCRPRSKRSIAAARWRSQAFISATFRRLDYQRHLFQERQVRSVSSNTRADARAFLRFAGSHHIAVSTSPYPFAHADHALAHLAAERISGAAVLIVD